MTLRELAELYKALADETRLSILALLGRHGELCVCEVMEVLGITQSKASRHLRYLRHAGLVLDRREGLWSYYRIHPDLDDKARALLISLDLALPPQEVERLDGTYAQMREQKGPGDKVCTNEAYLNDERSVKGLFSGGPTS